MARLASSEITREPLGNIGALGYEAGTFTDDGNGGGYSIKTKLGRLVWVKIRDVENQTPATIVSINSATASGTQDDPGEFFIESTTLTASGVYGFEAIGFGR